MLNDEAGDGVQLQPLAYIDDPAERTWAAEWLAAVLASEGVSVDPQAKEHIWSALGSLASAPMSERTLTGLAVLLQSQSLKQALAPYCIGGPWGRLWRTLNAALRFACSRVIYRIGGYPMAHTKVGKDQLLARVRRISGQVAAIEKAIADEAGCAIVLHQVAGVRGAVFGLMDELIEEHLREHVARPELDDAERAQGADDLIAAIRRYAK